MQWWRYRVLSAIYQGRDTGNEPAALRCEETANALQLILENRFLIRRPPAHRRRIHLRGPARFPLSRIISNLARRTRYVYPRIPSQASFTARANPPRRYIIFLSHRSNTLPHTSDPFPSLRVDNQTTKMLTRKPIDS